MLIKTNKLLKNVKIICKAHVKNHISKKHNNLIIPSNVTEVLILYISITEIPEVLHIHVVTRYTSNAVGKAVLVKHICKLCCFSSVLAIIFQAYMRVKNCAAKIMLCMLQTSGHVHFNC